MSLSELKSFNAVAVGGSFVRGAELLHRSQPTVTAQVRALEARYGVELFFRSRGQVARLTSLGLQLFETTRTLFQLERDAQAILTGQSGIAQATLRLGVIAPRSAMPLVADYSRRHSEVGIDVRIGNSARILQWLRSYEIDVGILGAHERDPVLYMRRFATPEIVLLASAGHHCGREGYLSHEAFAQETLVLRESGSETRSLIEAALSRHGWKPARQFEVGSREGVAAAAEEGLGVAPISLPEMDPRPGVRVLRFKDFSVYGEMYITCMNNRRHIPMIREIMDLPRDV